MARVELFERGIQPQSPEVTPFRAPDFGPGIGPGVEKLGQSIGQAAQRANEIADVSARIEANRHTIALNNLAVNITQRVRSTLGEGAEAAADTGIADLKRGADEILASSSPRARRILEPMFAQRTTDIREQLWNHGFEQKKSAYDTSSQAANDGDLNTALEQATDDAAQSYLHSITERNSQRARFFGLGPAWERLENSKYVSSYYKGRALSLAPGSATAAVHYAIQHRGDLSADDFNSIVRSYRDASLDESSAVEAARYEHGVSFHGDALATTTNTAEGPIRRADPKMVFNALEVPNEGSRLVIDSNGAPVRYGINQGDNPDINVANLTLAGAQKIFIDRVWTRSGADQLPAALAVVHADTFFLNPTKAKQFLDQSGGDVQRYIELRNNFLASLHARNPAKYPDYTSRNERVEHFAGMVGGDGSPRMVAGPISPTTNLTPITDDIMARTDIPLALKVRIIRNLRERRESMRQDRQITEDDARDSLVTAATKLDTGFTSIKQLPPDALANASPETVASLTRMARTNRYKANDSKLLPELSFVEFTDPQRFMSKDYVDHLMNAGASPALINRVHTQQNEIMRRQMSAKPSVTQDGTLWREAKPAFEAAGLLDPSQPLAKGAGRISSRLSDSKAHAQLQMQATAFLQNLATTWEQENPGKKPSPDTMRQWVGSALLYSHPGQRAFQASDQDIFNGIPDNLRQTFIRGLRRHGDTSTGPEMVRHVANAWRAERALYGTTRIVHGRDGSMRGAPLQGIEANSGVPNDTHIDMSESDYGDEDQ